MHRQKLILGITQHLTGSRIGVDDATIELHNEYPVNGIRKVFFALVHVVLPFCIVLP
jgi:hypothetical protein